LRVVQRTEAGRIVDLEVEGSNAELTEFAFRMVDAIHDGEANFTIGKCRVSITLTEDEHGKARQR
jgi:hypothetical protein